MRSAPWHWLSAPDDPYALLPSRDGAALPIANATSRPGAGVAMPADRSLQAPGAVADAARQSTPDDAPKRRRRRNHARCGAEPAVPAALRWACQRRFGAPVTAAGQSTGVSPARAGPSRSAEPGETAQRLPSVRPLPRGAVPVRLAPRRGQASLPCSANRAAATANGATTTYATARRRPTCAPVAALAIAAAGLVRQHKPPSPERSGFCSRHGGPDRRRGTASHGPCRHGGAARVCGSETLRWEPTAAAVAERQPWLTTRRHRTDGRGAIHTTMRPQPCPARPAAAAAAGQLGGARAGQTPACRGPGPPVGLRAFATKATPWPASTMRGSLARRSGMLSASRVCGGG